jgi:hypothetical protein
MGIEEKDMKTAPGVAAFPGQRPQAPQMTPRPMRESPLAGLRLPNLGTTFNRFNDTGKQAIRAEQAARRASGDTPWGRMQQGLTAMAQRLNEGGPKNQERQAARQQVAATSPLMNAIPSGSPMADRLGAPAGRTPGWLGAAPAQPEPSYADRWASVTSPTKRPMESNGMATVRRGSEQAQMLGDQGFGWQDSGYTTRGDARFDTARKRALGIGETFTTRAPTAQAPTTAQESAGPATAGPPVVTPPMAQGNEAASSATGAVPAGPPTAPAQPRGLESMSSPAEDRALLDRPGVVQVIRGPGSAGSGFSVDVYDTQAALSGDEREAASREARAKYRIPEPGQAERDAAMYEQQLQQLKNEGRWGAETIKAQGGNKPKIDSPVAKAFLDLAPMEDMGGVSMGHRVGLDFAEQLMSTGRARSAQEAAMEGAQFMQAFNENLSAVYGDNAAEKMTKLQTEDPEQYNKTLQTAYDQALKAVGRGQQQPANPGPQADTGAGLEELGRMAAQQQQNAEQQTFAAAQQGRGRRGPVRALETLTVDEGPMRRRDNPLEMLYQV